MSLPNLLYFYRRRLRARLGQELFALLGIAVGVALLFAVQVSNTSLSSSVVQLTHRLVGHASLQIAARDDRGFDARLLKRVQAIDGVTAAAPLLQAQIRAVGLKGTQSLTLFAADPRFARLGGDLLHDFTAGQLGRIRAVVLPDAVAKALGSRFATSIQMQFGGRSRSVPVGAIVDERDVGPVADSPTALAPLAYAQELTGMRGRLSRIYVATSPGRRDVVEAALRRIAGDRLDVEAADFDKRVFAQAATPNNQSTALFAAISALVGFLFAFNAMLMLSRQRRSLIAELRMSGFGIATVVQVLVFDALVLGTVASLLGLALGDELSRGVFDPAPGYLTIAFPVATARTVHWQTIAIAVTSGVAAALLATLSPLVSLRSSAAIDAVEDERLEQQARRASFDSPWSLGAAVACLLVTTAILIFAPAAAMVGMATLIASMLLALPTILSSALALMNAVRPRIRSVVPLVAIGELRSNASRSIAVAAIAAIAVCGSTAIEAAHGDLQRGLDRDSHELNATTDVWVSLPGISNTLATAPFSAPMASAVRRLPEVASVQVYRGGFLNVGTRRVWVIAPPRTEKQPFPPSQMLEGDVRVASDRIRAGGWVTVSRTLADAWHIRIGQRFTLPAPRPTTYRLAGVTTNLGWTPGALVVNASDYRAAWHTDDAAALHVWLRPSVAPGVGLRAVRRALGANASAFTVETARQREQRQQSASRQGLARLTQIARLVLLSAPLAIAVAIGAMIWQRRRRLADLKLAGIGHRDLWRALMLESALLLSVGCAAGGVFGVYGQQLLDRQLGTVTGFPVETSIGIWVGLASFAVVSLVALAVTLAPGYLAARVPADLAFDD